MPPFNKLRNDTGVLLKATPPEIQRLAEVGSVNLYVVNPVVVVDGFAVQSLDSNVDSLVRLTDMSFRTVPVMVPFLTISWHSSRASTPSR